MISGRVPTTTQTGAAGMRDYRAAGAEGVNALGPMSILTAMRIGHIAWSYRPIIGGAEVYVDQLLQTLEADGHDCRIYQRDPGPTLRASDPRVVAVARCGRSLHAFNLLLMGHLGRLAAEDRLVIHDTFHFPPAAWHPRTIALSHGVTWDDPGGGRRAMVRRRLARLAWRRAHTVVANDTAFLRAMGLDIAPRSEPFEEVAPGRFYIPNVVDPAVFSPGPARPDLAGADVVLVPRNIFASRGIHLAIDAFAVVANERPEALLVVAGDWLEPDYRRTVFAHIAARSLAGRVLFAGAVSHASMLELYRSAALTCVPSLFGEGTSLAALESMSCGTPVLATAVGGLRDLPVELAEARPEAFGPGLRRALERRDELAGRQRAAVLRDFRPERWRAAWSRAILR